MSDIKETETNMDKPDDKAANLDDKITKPDDKAAKPGSSTTHGSLAGPQNLTLNTHKAGMEGMWQNTE